MNPYLRNTLVVIGALIIGSVVNMGIISISPSIIAPPEGVDPTDMDNIAANIDKYEFKHFLMVFLAHALGTLAGAYFAARLVTKAPAFFGFLIGVISLIGGIAAAKMIPAPMTFIIIDLVFAYLPFALIANVMARKKRSDW
ncbi:hypothetical protein K6119_11650 [Paracrocinitomix mangrovi]|uniref:hypothetical protein n=1 Tax=Paracrocinitomix mangrovi TaxID=2862509 RepID=UPI001C8EF8B8|nr:hypothetical protein [Paracrocinitomix mangrovi]UKN00389.1 hypothetical protein K6119_11650 [Paracrocinitomix mangrovi]